MDYQEALNFLYTQLPMYQRQGPAAYKKDLSNTIKILDLLGHPQTEFKSIHIAGTNGKGSTSHMIASILQEAGYKVGLYTSPHLKDYRERIRLNGKLIPQEWVAQFIGNYQEEFKKIQPSFFEITVGMAFTYFRDIEVDIAIIETGLGGRLDSTNIIKPELSIITNIGLDHMQFLGNTIEAIASEKGGIIKEQVPLVLGEMMDEAESTLIRMAQEKNAEVYYAKNMSGELPASDLVGPYQGQNIKTALTALRVLKNKTWEIDTQHVLEGISKVQENTGLKGRWQILGTAPKIIADCAHNEDGLKMVFQNIAKEKFKNLHVVIAVVEDKDLDKTLDLFPKNAQYYFSEAKIARALPVEDLAQKAFHKNLKGENYTSIAAAYSAARLYSEKEDLILITGSIFTVAEVV